MPIFLRAIGLLKLISYWSKRFRKQLVQLQNYIRKPPVPTEAPTAVKSYQYLFPSHEITFKNFIVPTEARKTLKLLPVATIRSLLYVRVRTWQTFLG
jgi:hypothetical protein